MFKAQHILIIAHFAVIEVISIYLISMVEMLRDGALPSVNCRLLCGCFLSFLDISSQRLTLVQEAEALGQAMRINRKGFCISYFMRKTMSQMTSQCIPQLGREINTW